VYVTRLTVYNKHISLLFFPRLFVLMVRQCMCVEYIEGRENKNIYQSPCLCCQCLYICSRCVWEYVRGCRFESNLSRVISNRIEYNIEYSIRVNWNIGVRMKCVIHWSGRDTKCNRSSSSNKWMLDKSLDWSRSYDLVDRWGRHVAVLHTFPR